MFSKLASNLEKAKVPLGFDCGFSCSCGTCPVVIEDKEQFAKLQQDQPMS
jgi:ferredoxin